MEIYYRREMKGNYLIIKSELWLENNYSVKMMINNTITGLLKFRIKYIDQKHIYYYEITSKQPLSRILESRYITVNEIRKIISQISEMLDHIEIYLLREEQILLDKEYIYVDPDTFDLYLCLIPGYKTDFATDLGLLLQYILKKVDHQDQESVILAYGLFQESQKENYGITDLLKLVAQNDDDKAKPTIHEVDQGEKKHDIIAEVPEKEVVIEKAERRPKLRFFGSLMFMIAVPLVLWLLKGTGVMRYYVPYLIGWEILCILFLYLPLKQEKVDPKTDLHQIFEFDLDLTESKDNLIVKDKKVVPKVIEQDCQTVLLVNLDDRPEVRTLVSLDHQVEDICILYYPFIIGKLEGMVDYAITKETISRFHIRIDKVDEEFYITDLNSTNGTRVKDKLLETNEKMKINVNDEVYLAEFGFRFS